MAYCTETEVLEMMKEDALNAIIGDGYIEDETERQEKILPIVTAAIEDAEGEIDGYLAKRYPVPLAPVPKVIAKFAKDIAVYNLYSRIGIDESEREKNYLNRYKSAIDFLKLVMEGKVSLGVNTFDSGKVAASTGFVVKSSDRLFSRDSLRGM